ncbi:uncharacterized protein LOC126413207 [Schistocerca serialis cubense]|uniref:uncharacterized protein LOC126413207 n=1 Tax=Schistocerca serialis cubense TaxID=2023355 RepID=UPI00214EA382|nr:uncharacterized protein LOC126413207 [Schistocerca serialis cubense]
MPLDDVAQLAGRIPDAITPAQASAVAALDNSTNNTASVARADHDSLAAKVELLCAQAALLCHEESWQVVLLGLRTTFKPDLRSSAAELVYGETLRLPGGFVDADAIETVATGQPDFLRRLRDHVSKIRPPKATRHDKPPTFAHQDLEQCRHVILRCEGVKSPLQAPYSGPYEVLRRSAYTMDILVNGKTTTVALNRVKPAYVFPDTPLPAAPRPRRPLTAVPDTDATPPAPALQRPPPNAAQHPPPDAVPPPPTRTTRSGRRVHFPARYLDTDAPLPPGRPT